MVIFESVVETASFSSDGSRLERVYCVNYVEPSEGRQQALDLLESFGKLYPTHSFLQEIQDLPIIEANAWLKANPREQQFDSYFVKNPLFDDIAASAFARINELKCVHIRSEVISDRGVEYLLHLQNLDHLLLYAENVTDLCLRTLCKLSALRMLDLQGSQKLSTKCIQDCIAKARPEIELWYSGMPYSR